MAIQVRSIGANRDMVSMSLSASVSESPATLTVTVLNNGSVSNPSSISSVGGVPFQGQLVSYENSKEQGKFLTTRKYIDNSVYLDQNCIVLYRRGLPGGPITKGKTVRVPFVDVSYGSGRVNFVFSEKRVNVFVQRMGGFSKDGLGTEEWSSNPCDSSNVSYFANEATSIIGAPNVGGFLCSYEGTFRSVLSSIYSDAGVGYWWDWRNNTINVIRGSIGIPNLADGCGVLSSTSGATREGVSSLSSWHFQRWPGRQVQEASASVVFNNHFSTSPIKHPNYPTDNQILEKVCQPLAIYNALISKNFRKLGYQIFSEINLSISVTNPKWLDFLARSFNFDPKETNFEKALFKYLNIEGPGTFYLASQLDSDAQNDEFTQELYYPYNLPEDPSTSGGDEYSFNEYETSLNPQPTVRGKNPFAQSFEDQNNIVRSGLWRGVSEHVSGDTDATDFSEAVEDCIKTVPHEVICQIHDQKALPEEDEIIQLRNVGSSGVEQGFYESKGARLRDEIEKNGKVIIFVKQPKYAIEVSAVGAETNPNDLSEVYNYEDPNSLAIPQDLQGGPDTQPELVDPCRDAVPNFNNPNLDIIFNNGQENAPDLKPGLEHASGDVHTISCNGKSIKVIMPSFSSYKVVRTSKAKYSRRQETGFAEAINSWGFAGPSSSKYGLSHSVVITDVTPSEDEVFSSFDVPAAIGGGQPKWLSTFSAECDGFYLPIVPGLESLSASLDSRGLRVSYSYKEIPPYPKTFRMLTSSRRNVISNTNS